MAGVLVVAEVRDGQLFTGSLAAFSFAAQVAERTGSHFDVFLAGEGIGAAAQEAAHYGARKIVVDDEAAYANYIGAAYAYAVSSAAKSLGSSFVTATATTFGKDLLPRVAVRLGAGMLSDVTAIAGEHDGKLVYKRPMWAGNVLAHVQVHTATAVISVRGTDFDKPARVDSASPVESVSSNYQAPANAAKFVKMDKTESERPELTEARVVVSGGRGLKDGENFYQIMEPLADKLGAAIGASRAAVDAGFCPNDLQIGQTGKVVAPDLYIAVAISGAIQHVAGMKASKTIVAINKDQEAPIFQIADYGLVGDAFKLVPELVEAL